jgi:hypothetical protein
MRMGYNPKTYNLFQQIDISNALEKIVSYIDSSEEEEPKLFVATDNPFALRMKFYRYIQAYRIQMANKEGADPHRYDTLVIEQSKGGITIKSVLDTIEDLQITNMNGEKI